MNEGDPVPNANIRAQDSLKALVRAIEISAILNSAESDTDAFLEVVTWRFGMSTVDISEHHCAIASPGFEELRFSLGAAVNSKGAFCIRVFLMNGLVFIPNTFQLKDPDGQIHSWEVPVYSSSNTFRFASDGMTVGFMQIDGYEALELLRLIEISDVRDVHCRLRDASHAADIVLCSESIETVLQAGRLRQLLSQ